MTLHRSPNLALSLLGAFVFALVLSASGLLDGPSELDAIQATADAKQDAINSVASSAYPTGARGQKDHKLMVAQVAP